MAAEQRRDKNRDEGSQTTGSGSDSTPQHPSLPFNGEGRGGNNPNPPKPPESVEFKEPPTRNGEVSSNDQDQITSYGPQLRY